MYYSLLDAARLGYNLTAAKALNPNHVSLYRGGEDPQMIATAPVLFWYQPHDPFAQWLDQQWGTAPGITLVARIPPDELRKHLRRFLLIATDNGQQLYFRYYDPRILKVFLPTCDEDQIETFFGPVESYTVEDPENNQTITFYQEQAVLRQTYIERPNPQPTPPIYPL